MLVGEGFFICRLQLTLTFAFQIPELSFYPFIRYQPYNLIPHITGCYGNKDGLFFSDCFIWIVEDISVSCILQKKPRFLDPLNECKNVGLKLSKITNYQQNVKT